jgi:hypothetical protein
LAGRYASQDELVAAALERLRTETPLPEARSGNVTEDEFNRQLLERGLMTSLPTAGDRASRPAFEPITIEGEALSQSITRERR